MSRIEQKLKEMGFSVPALPAPLAAYVPGILCGDLVFTSGQLPIQDGNLVRGKLGDNIAMDDACKAARQCALNCLAVVKSLAGDLDRIEQIVKVTGFVNSTQDFEDQPKVVNGASEFFLEVFGEKGKHSRSAVGVASLPRGACCEIEIIVKIK